jgi:hypothetical protein
VLPAAMRDALVSHTEHLCCSTLYGHGHSIANQLSWCSASQGYKACVLPRQNCCSTDACSQPMLNVQQPSSWTSVFGIFVFLGLAEVG